MIVVLIVLLVVWSAAAQAQTAATRGGGETLVLANEVIREAGGRRLIARGLVEVRRGTRSIMADEVIYDSASDRLRAVGNVAVVEDNGDVVFFAEVDVDAAFTDGAGRDIRMVLRRSWRVRASDGRLSTKEGRQFTLQHAQATPCEECARNPERPPIWRITARRVVVDDASKDFIYSNAAMEIFGVPVLYTPYFTHPAPDVRRRSGLVSFDVGRSVSRGFYAQPQYFIAFGDSADLSLRPRLYVQRPARPMFDVEARKRGDTFDVSLRPRFAYDGGRLRYLLRGALRWDIDDNWRALADADYSGDRAFHEDFGIDRAASSRSVAAVERFAAQSFLQFRAAHYQDLHFDGFAGHVPNAGFHALAHQRIPLLVLGGTLETRTLLRQTLREHGPSTSSAIQTVEWQRRALIGGGQVVGFGGQLMGRLDRTTSGPADIVDPLSNGLPTVARSWGSGDATGWLEWSYPFVAPVGTSGSWVIEPRALLIGSGRIAGTRPTLNEDSRSLEMDFSSIFSLGRHTGFDRRESGLRVVYGLRSTLGFASGESLTVEAGQLRYLLGTDNFGGRLRAPGDKASDWVVGVRGDFGYPLSLDMYGRFDARDLGVVQAYVAPTLRHRLFGRDASLTVGYAHEGPASPLGRYPGVPPPRDSVIAYMRAPIGEYWTIEAGMRFDITRRNFTDYQAGITYEDECFLIRVLGQRGIYFAGIGTEAAARVLVQVTFKQLTTLSFQTN
ncbi:MAG: LPS-assembly protein LptD [Alphaproteobacteria bacterium]|nr:LPS-assembly protein LptD [Alphaproteobacteria bacterium]MCW5742901.1 LPS-assembly protein LptD [Alphaproteobacteria bacterium]